MVEWKDKQTKDTHAESKFEREFGSKTAVLVVRMTESLRGSWRDVMMVNAFVYMT